MGATLRDTVIADVLNVDSVGMTASRDDLKACRWWSLVMRPGDGDRPFGVGSNTIGYCMTALTSQAAGVFVIVVTPFHPDGLMDMKICDRMVDFYLEAGLRV